MALAYGDVSHSICLSAPKVRPIAAQGMPSLGEATLGQQRKTGKQTLRLLRTPSPPAATAMSFAAHSPTGYKII